MEAALWVLLPGFVAVASALLAWFVTQSKMDVKLAEQRELLAETRGAIAAERQAMELATKTAIRAAEETARREAFDTFLGELKVEQRHYTRENRMLMNSRKSLVLQERMYFRNLPLSDWIEHEIVLDDAADLDRLVRDMTVFDKAVVNIADAPKRKQLA
jgi:adenylosuccinate lyase